MPDRRIGYAALAAFVGTIFAANWLITHVGLVHVGFGLLAPAGVYAAGLAFTFRDLAHRALGPLWILAAIAVGALLSAIISPTFAAASAIAFGVSELCDLLVYTPLHQRTWLGSVALSNTVGLLLDSAVFLWIAFGSLALFWGQVVGKAWMTVLAVAVLALVRHRAVLARNA